MNLPSPPKKNRCKDNTNSPMVSVVVPAYNHENYVLDCINSILEQDYPNIDLIVINDGSTDKTDQKIKEILKENPLRFRYISKSNEGLIKTLNLGLRLSRGKYFCELASDDMLLPGSVRKRIDYLEANPDTDVIFADAYLINNYNKTTIRASKGKRMYRGSKNNVKDLIDGKARMFFPSGMFRKSILDKFRGFDEDFRFYEDVSMKYQLAIHAKIGYLGEPVMYYRRHQANTSCTHSLERRKEKILALEKLFLHMDEELNTFVRRELYKEYKRFVKFSFDHIVDREKLAKAYKKMIRIFPFAVKLRYYMILSKIKGYVKEIRQ